MLTSEFEKTGQEIQEPGMERFNQPGWVNRVWTSDRYRRAHIDVVDAKETRGLWMMHCCVFPHTHNNAPIFGLDVIAGARKITGFFHDYSPVLDKNHPMCDSFCQQSSELEWNKKRELPDWARAIFSDHMISAGNVQKDHELQQIIDFSEQSIYGYLCDVGDYNHSANEQDIITAHNRYSYYQKQNPHTPRTMRALGLSDDDVTAFIGQCLFPEL